jgi:predicted amidohydrolase YtcJ
VKDEAAAFAKLADYVAADPSDEVLVSWGYDVVAMGGYIDKAELDAVSATKPILVWDASEHFVFGNSGAIRKLGRTPALAKEGHRPVAGGRAERPVPRRAPRRRYC